MLINKMSVLVFVTFLQGGMKAVLWTDVFQVIVIFTGITTTIVFGAKAEGGFGKVWQMCEVHGKLNFMQ